MENENAVVDAADVRTLETITADIRSSLRTITEVALMGAIHIGKCLIEAKDLVSHGEWLLYLENNVGFSDRSAQNYMRLYKEYGENVNPQLAADLSYTNALKLLILPDDEQKEIKGKIESGELVTEDITAEIETMRIRMKELEEENAGLQLKLEDMEDYTPTDDEIAELKTRAEKAERDAADYNKQMEELRGKADDAAQKLKDAKAKADAAAQKKIDKAVEDAKAELEAKAASASAGEIEKLKSNLEAAEARAAAAEKSAAIASDPSKVKLEMIYHIIQTNVDDAMGVIMRSSGEDAVKYRDGFKRFLETMIGRTEV
jgi:hypothetical protein